MNYSHHHTYRGFTIAVATDNGKPVGSFGDTPVFARYVILDEFEQNVIPLDQWFWSPPDVYAAVDALVTMNPTCDPKNWKGYYDRIVQYRRAARLSAPLADAVVDLLAQSEDWTFDSGEECAERVQNKLKNLVAQLDKVGPVPREML
jgi:hypothetical protein